ncbi:hypothetical protein V6N11_057064 [Hibiscus sabdariffa]|uniref:MADS-box domain-containing protein n=1 Tax=Hibiscus sabdariffa TaxID=183260 RepID=A0ABR1ZVY7_9ROSI
MVYVLRALERLDGFSIFGFRVKVQLARHSSCRVTGKIRDSERFKQRQPEKLGSEPQKDMMNQVYGVIDPVKYDTLKNCTVGWRKRFIRAGRLPKELHDAGVRGVTIMSISGSKFLTMFKDSVQKQSFMEEHGGALEEWFKEIKDWSVDMEVVNRKAWIACHGIPIHAWSAVVVESHVNNIVTPKPVVPIVDSDVFIGEESSPNQLVAFGQEGDAQLRSVAKNQEQNYVELDMGAMDSYGNSDFGRSRAEEDVRGMGLGNTMSRADLVDKANSANSASIYFLERQGTNCKSSRRYASMIELQEKAITVKGKKKARLEVDGSSPTNSDIARKQILTQAARKAMALDKHLGVEFIGDDDEILSKVKQVWLVSIGAALWSIWLARCEKEFNGKGISVKELLFLTKLRSLFWLNVVHDNWNFYTEGWWQNPISILTAIKPLSKNLWCPSITGWLKFNIGAVVIGPKVGCGGVLRDDSEDGEVMSTWLDAEARAADMSTLLDAEARAADMSTWAILYSSLCEDQRKFVSLFIKDVREDSAVVGGSLFTKLKKKIKIAYFNNDVARNVAYKKRKNVMVKKLSEITTLCGVGACVVLHSSGFDSQPET